MDMRKPMTATEKKIFKEQVISEYKKRVAATQKKSAFQEFMDNLKKLAPVNIMLGIIASILMIWINGWKTYFYLMLSGIIWITIISTTLSALAKSK